LVFTKASGSAGGAGGGGEVVAGVVILSSLGLDTLVEELGDEPPEVAARTDPS
jgi:hypothetical protein